MQNLRFFHAVSLFSIRFFFIPPFLHFSPVKTVERPDLHRRIWVPAMRRWLKTWRPNAGTRRPLELEMNGGPGGVRFDHGLVFPKKYVVFIREIPQESKPPGPKPNQEFTD